MDLQAFLEERFKTVESKFTLGMLAQSKSYYMVEKSDVNKDQVAMTLATFVCQAAAIALRSLSPPWISPWHGFRIASSDEALLVNVAGRIGLLLFRDARGFSPFAYGEQWAEVFSFGEGRWQLNLPMMWYDAVINTMERNAEALKDLGTREQVALTARIARQFVEEQALFLDCLHELPVISVIRPPTIFTGVPRPAWGVSLVHPSLSRVTAGLIGVDSSGRRGITTALHGLGDPIPPLGTEVLVEGHLCTLEAIDPISDSCFISIPDALQPLGSFGGRGILSGRTPGQGENAIFERIGAGRKTTRIVLVDPFVTIATNLSQKKLYTSADTQIGDSGAALVDMQDRVIGFSLERTGIAAPIDFSVWVWADLVVKRLNITPLP